MCEVQDTYALTYDVSHGAVAKDETTSCSRFTSMELQEHVPPLTNVVLAVGALDVCLILDELLVLEGFDTSPATATGTGSL